MICEICGAEFQPSGHGKRQRYCSESCRNKAKYRRRKKRPTDSEEKKPVRNGNVAKTPEPAGTPAGDLDKRNFDRMMDGSMLDMLRANRDRLLKAMDDSATPANALPAISRQLIAVCERIESLQGGGLNDLLDDEEDEVMEDVGASIV
ncbi:hypothetical protein [Bifidobacterium dentium]|uniref:hypothetical protein n=1 Tax=Bifidobacterium dentium TaxID=1689 RepID=UPI0022E671B0|nr:hypothetical protein [Bifidobacterium dentium]